MAFVIAGFLALGSVVVSTPRANAGAAIAEWPVYHQNPGRTGLDAAFPTVNGTLSTGWSAVLDGAVYAEPLVVNGSVIAATEGDSVYAINPANGAVQWRKNLGTPVPLSTLPCGGIDPLGITGTPAFDPVTDSIFAVAEVTGPQHILFALDPATGAIRWSRNIDLAGDDPKTHQQRPALAVANGFVYVGLGGLAGDCGQYVGEVIGVPATGTGATISYRVPTTREGAIWATGGPVIDGSGNLYVSVGNGASTTTYDGSDSVIELSPTLAQLSLFAPSSWAADNASDLDLGSISPALVPGGWVFISGKSGTGYVLKAGALGGIGGQVASAPVCAGFGGMAQSGNTIYVPCTGSIREVTVDAGTGALTTGWTSTAAGSSPVVGGGAVWSVNTSTGRLFALDQSTGATLGSIAVGPVPHFVSPTLWQNQVLVGTMSGITSVGMATSTYHPLPPARLLDTRTGNGLSGKLVANTPRTFQVTGRGGVPAGASAVTGNVTVVSPSHSWAVFLGPQAVANPTTSTINFAAGQTTGNGVTVVLGTGGTLSATFMSTAGQTTDLVFDVTGYFTPDNTGSTYHPIAPTRILDTRTSTGLSTRLSAGTPRTFQVSGKGGIPAGVVAITGNLTVVAPSNGWGVFVGPTASATPATSSVNFTANQVSGNNLTVGLATDGSLSATYMSTPGNTTDLVLDVTGYYTADLTGAVFVPVPPTRLLDTRVGTGLTGKLSAGVPRTFAAASLGGFATDALAVTGNLTVVNQSAGWAAFIGPTPAASPGTSTLNFSAGEVKGNGLTVELGSNGSLSATYISSSGNTTDLVLDMTGYFVQFVR